jgi:PKD domain
MRRRSHVFVLVVGAAAVLLLSAPALGDPTLVDTVALSAGSIQHSPAIAVDPDATRAAVVADNGMFAPPPRATATSTADWSVAPGAWSPPVDLPHPSSTTAGQADIAWGIDTATEQNVYTVDLGSPGGGLCQATAVISLESSSNGGASYVFEGIVASASTLSEVIEPAIAVDRAIGRVYVAYTRLEWGSAGCNGAPDSSQIWLAYSDIASLGFGTSWTTRRVSPLATSGSAHYRSPALAVLPDGRTVVAFRDDGAASPQIESETCVSPSQGINYCNPPSAGNVGPSVVLGDATAPALVDGVVGPPTPSVVAAGGRVTVAWHASTAAGVRVFAAMSTNGGATYGPAQQIDPAGAGNQIAPELAATLGGRVDAAYLWDAGGGSVRATVVSAGAPLPGSTTEAWAQPVVVQAVGASSTTPITGQAAPLGRRLGVATAAVSTPASPLPATVVAYTDTQSGQNVHVVGLLHGTTIPAIATQTVTASKNVQTVVHVTGSDEDGDPLTWSTGAQPTTPGSSVTVADAARGDFSFTAANEKGTDTFEAVANDGVPGHEARTLINVVVINDRPEIICPSLVARENTPLDIPVADCVRDHNGDPITVDIHDAIGGTVERSSGIWRFIPTPNSTAPGSFVLEASDGDLTGSAVVRVTIATAVGTVNLAVTGAGKRREIARGVSLRFAGTAVDSQGQEFRVTWNFGDDTPVARGRAVSHRFRRDGAFTVKASAPGAAPVQIRVLVRKRAVEVVGPPVVADGILRVRVRTRTAGKLSVRVDSRSRTITVPAGMTETLVSIQVTTGPMVRLSLRLQPAKATALPALSLRRLVLVSPLSAG